MDPSIIIKSFRSFPASNLFSIIDLGVVGTYPIILIKMRKNVLARPNILIAGGFHGNEPAGTLGILQFLNEYSQSAINKINISFLPLVNPTGFDLNQRDNKWKQNPNRGFYHQNILPQSDLSLEGKILMLNEKLLLHLARDGFLSLHEDVDLKSGFIYDFNGSGIPRDFLNRLIKTMSSFVEIYSEETLYGEENSDGIILTEHEGSLEDYFHHHQIVYSICTETPGLEDMSRRVNANCALVESFIQLVKIAQATKAS